MKMVALTKFNYGTRRLKAGDEFEPSLGNQDLMISLSLARELPDGSDPDAKYERAEIGLDIWREQYRMIYGHRCDMRWGVKRIRQEIQKIPGDHKIMKNVP